MKTKIEKGNFFQIGTPSCYLYFLGMIYFLISGEIFWVGRVGVLSELDNDTDGCDKTATTGLLLNILGLNLYCISISSFPTWGPRHSHFFVVF